MGVLFGILLEDFRMTNIISRVQPFPDGSMPAQCTNPAKFYQTYSYDFKKICGREFDAKLTRFLFRKFSIDPHGKCMVPDAGKKLKTLSWTGFFITDEELPDIVERVMLAYDQT